MNRDDCKRIIENIEVIRHFAEGGDVETCGHDYTGKFIAWWPCKRLLLSSLGKYRVCKPHLKIVGGKLTEQKKPPCYLSH